MNIKRRDDKVKVKFLLGSVLFGILLSASLVVGGNVDRGVWEFRGFSYIDTFRFLVYAIVTTIVFYLVLCRIGQASQGLKQDEFLLRKWITKSAIIFICWIPYLLMFYPGNLSVDSYWSIQQILGNVPLSNAHPIMYTALVGFFVKIGMTIKDLEFGIALYSVFQMLVLSVVFGGVCEWLRKRSSKKWIVVLATVFFALNPLVAMYAITMWKDILFSTWVLLLVVYLYKLLGDEKEVICGTRTRVILSILGLLVAFGRNNGIYIVCLVYLSLIFYYRKFWKKTIPVFGIVLIFISLVQGPGYSIIGVQKGNLAESLAVPLQQIAYTVKHDGEIEESQAEFLENIIPLDKMAEVYIPYSANGVKFDSEFDNEFLENNVVEFLKVWGQMLPANFKNYVKAYLMHTLGYWHIGTNDWRCIYGVVDSPGIEGIDFIEKITGVDFSENLSHFIESKINTIPIINLIYSIAFSVWTVVFAGVCFIESKKSKYLITILPLIGNWITIMIASPIFCEFRYMFSLHITLPVIFSMIYFEGFSTSKEDDVVILERNREE